MPASPTAQLPFQFVHRAVQSGQHARRGIGSDEVLGPLGRGAQFDAEVVALFDVGRDVNCGEPIEKPGQLFQNSIRHAAPIY